MKKLSAVYCGYYDDHHLDALFYDEELANTYAKFRGDGATVKEKFIYESEGDLVGSSKWMIDIDIVVDHYGYSLDDGIEIGKPVPGIEYSEVLSIERRERKDAKEGDDSEYIVTDERRVTAEVSPCRTGLKNNVYFHFDDIHLRVILDRLDFSTIEEQKKQTIEYAIEYFNKCHGLLKENISEEEIKRRIKSGAIKVNGFEYEPDDEY